MLIQIFSSLFLMFFGSLLLPIHIYAQEGEVLGIHILNPDESSSAKQMLQVTENQSDAWHYVTIPFTLDDVDRPDYWQTFFNQAKDQKLIPLVRLTTEFEDNAWKIPNRKEITDMISTLAQLDWPTDDKHIIIFNEVNHSKEWGGTLDPESYAQVLTFAADWAHSENVNFKVLPAAMDLAAPNGSQALEAFNYLEQMYGYDDRVFKVIDIWNSHSYPNPGFSSAPTRTGKNSLRGFEYELAYLKEKTNKNFDVMITETGWVETYATRQWLPNYYTYALQHIWSHPQVIAVTPFLYRGAPGPFSTFSFVDEVGQPTAQYLALRQALQTVEAE